LIALALLTLSTACTSPCRTDLDCDASEMLQRCNTTTNACEELLPNAPRTCSEVGDCTGGRACVDGECVFAPTCQTVLSDSPFRYIASCTTAGEVTGVAVPTTTGCRVAFSLQDLLGGDRELVSSTISAETPTVSDLSTSGGDLSCAGGGGWDGTTSSTVFVGCAVAGDTCDVAMSRQRAGMRVCMTDAHCAADQTCGLDVTQGAVGGGRCQ
jgi:hypothetical protein